MKLSKKFTQLVKILSIIVIGGMVVTLVVNTVQGYNDTISELNLQIQEYESENYNLRTDLERTIKEKNDKNEQLYLKLEENDKLKVQLELLKNREKDRMEVKTLTTGTRIYVHDGDKQTPSASYLVNEFNLLTKSNATAYELNTVLEGTALEGLGDDFIKAEERYHVNAIFLTALAIHESGWGNSSNIARYKDNIFGYNAQDTNPTAKATTFNSKEESIRFVAGRLSMSYLDEAGRYFKGYTLKAVNHYYSTPEDWKDKVANTMITVDTMIQNKVGGCLLDGEKN